MWAELEQRLVVIKADKTLCAMCGKKYPNPGKMRAHAFRHHREAFDFSLQAMIPEVNVLHAQHYSQEQSVSSQSSSCAAPSYDRCLNMPFMLP